VEELRSLGEYMKSIREKLKRLQMMRTEFLTTAKSEPDEFRRVASKTFARYAEVMEDLFMNIQMLAIANAGLRTQIETLRKIVEKLPEMKTNTMLQLEFEKTVNEYTEKFKKQYDEFLKFQHEFLGSQREYH
jgi:hypothetical protein